MLLFANAVAIINEGIVTKKFNVTFPSNNLIIEFLIVLKKNNYISSFSYNKISIKKYVTVYFLTTNSPSMRNIKLISTPSSLVPLNLKNLNKFFKRSSSSTIIITTSSGLFTVQEAFLNKLGGVALCIIN